LDVAIVDAMNWPMLTGVSYNWRLESNVSCSSYHHSSHDIATRNGERKEYEQRLEHDEKNEYLRL